jgi:hypothetical protein
MKQPSFSDLVSRQLFHHLVSVKEAAERGPCSFPKDLFISSCVQSGNTPNRSIVVEIAPGDKLVILRGRLSPHHCSIKPTPEVSMSLVENNRTRPATCVCCPARMVWEEDLVQWFRQEVIPLAHVELILPPPLSWQQSKEDRRLIKSFPLHPTADDLLDLFSIAKERRSNLLLGFLRQKSLKG